MSQVENVSSVVEITPKDLFSSIYWSVEADIPLLIWGAKGTGKSQIVSQFATNDITVPNKYRPKNKFRFVRVFLSQADSVGDLIGLPAHKDGRTVYDPPSWWPENSDEWVILFLDEINRIRQEFRNAIYGLIQDKVLYGKMLPQNVRIIAAANPPSEEYFDTEDFDEALIDRFAHVALFPTVEDWKDYAKKREMLDVVIDFAAVNHEVIIPKGKVTPDFSFTPTGRTIERLHTLIATMYSRVGHDGYTDEDFKSDLGIMAKAVLGNLYGEQFATFHSKMETPVTIEEWSKENEQYLKAKINRMYKLGRSDLIARTVDNVRDFLNSTNIDSSIVKKVLNTVKTLTPEYINKFLLNLIDDRNSRGKLISLLSKYGLSDLLKLTSYVNKQNQRISKSLKKGQKSP